MRRAVAALVFSLVSLVLVVLTWTGVLPWGGSIAATVAGFIGSFNGFVTTDPELRRQNQIAWVAAILGALVVLVGSGLFLGGILHPAP